MLPTIGNAKPSSRCVIRPETRSWLGSSSIQVQPQVYKEEVNFAAIKTALLSREKIDRKRRSQAGQGKESINVKVDRGGIRDIEFLVQCLQRVYGGSEPWLRSGGTRCFLSTSCMINSTLAAETSTN
jgi:glutamine synthetase adenylyltransferase